MPAGESTLASFPPQLLCLVSGASENDWNTSTCSPHLAQRYSYVGMSSPWVRHSRAGTRGLRVPSVSDRGRDGSSLGRPAPEWRSHDRRCAVCPAGLAPRHLPERPARRPGQGPRHHGRGLGQPRCVERGQAARLALRRARPPARLRQGRARGRGRPCGSAAGRVHTSSASRPWSATCSRCTARAGRGSPREAAWLVVLFPVIVVSLAVVWVVVARVFKKASLASLAHHGAVPDRGCHCRLRLVGGRGAGRNGGSGHRTSCGEHPAAHPSRRDRISTRLPSEEVCCSLYARQ